MKMVFALVALVFATQAHASGTTWSCDSGYAAQSPYGGTVVTLSPNKDGTYKATYAVRGGDVGEPENSGVVVAGDKLRCTFSDSNEQVVYCIQQDANGWLSLDASLQTFRSLTGGKKSYRVATEVILSGSNLKLKNGVLRYQVNLAINGQPDLRDHCGFRP